MPRPRLVRRQPLSQRLVAAINPWDFLLWLSEEIETRELDSPAVGTQIGLAANLLFLIARANSGPSGNAADDVFGDDSGVGWLSYLIHLLVWTGFALSILNTCFVFTRKRHYRLFEASIDHRPATSSAQRVRVKDSFASNSPLRLLGDLISFDSAESRAHPDSTRDVWELAVWDPRPAELALFAYFSPLHILLYLFALPLDPLEARPSIAVLRCLVLQAALSAMLWFVQSINNQRRRDDAVVQKEVLHEYDTKFVQPRLHPIVRDMGTQVSMNASHEGDNSVDNGEVVEFGTPITLIQRRGFQTHPNANYLKHIDPDYVPPSSSFDATGMAAKRSSSNSVAARLLTPANKPARHSDLFTPGHGSSSRSSRALRQSMPVGGNTIGLTSSFTSPAISAVPPPVTHNLTRTPRASKGMQATPGFSGNMDVYSHANSPLKKAISMNDLGTVSSPRNSREQAALEQRLLAERMQQQHLRRAGSPLKEEHVNANAGVYPQDQSSPPVPFNPFARGRPQGYKYERFPSRC